MRKFILAAAVACGAGAFGLPAQAQLLGTTVTGTLEFGSDPTNYYDPGNSFVPGGYDNSGGTTVTIDSNIEFGFSDGGNLDTADFTDDTLTLTDLSALGSTNWEQTFTDTAFSGLALSSVSDSFGLSSATLVGDVITIDWAGADTGGTFSASFDLGSPMPEPASMVLLATGLIGLGTMRRRKAKGSALGTR